MALYLPGRSPVHRLPAGAKLLALFLSSTCLFFVDDPVILGAVLLLVALGYRVAGISMAQAWQPLRQLLWLAIVFFLVHALTTSWINGVSVVLRLSALIALAVLLSLTTRASDLVEVIVRVLRPLGLVGLPVERLALMLSMTLRYIPMLYAGFQELREARLARGAGGGTLSVLMPLLIRSLRQADALAEAIDARGYDAGDHRRLTVQGESGPRAAGRPAIDKAPHDKPPPGDALP